MILPSAARFPVAALHLLLVLLLLAPAGALAVVVEDLEVAEVPVQDQSAAERQRAFAEALRRVLIKVSGDSRVLDHPAVSEAAGQASRYLREYRYLTREGVPGQGEEQEAPQRSLWLQISFDPRGIERLLRDHGLPVWGRERPATLIWLGYQDGRERNVLGSGSDPALLDQVLAAAQRRGAPLLIPLMDLEDRARVSYTDFRGGFDERILDASDRYDADAVLIGVLDARSDGTWRGRWTLHSGRLSETRALQGATLEDLLAQGFDFLADLLAGQYALNARQGGGASIALEVAGVQDLEDFARVETYLRGLTPVERVTVRRVVPGSVVYLLRLRGEPSDLQRIVRLGNLLEQSVLPSVDITQPASSAVLHYRLRP